MMKNSPSTKSQQGDAASDGKLGAGSSAQGAAPRSAVQTAALDQSVAYMLRRAQLSTFQAFASVMRGYNVRPINYAVLVLIHANPGLSQMALSSALGISKANFVMVLDALEARGFTERRRAPKDRRAFALHLTPEGDRFVRRLEHDHSRLEAHLQARLGDRKTGILLKLLREFCAAEKHHTAAKQPPSSQKLKSEA